MNYALIENGVVTNIIWLHPKNIVEFPNAVPVNQLLVCIGDTYMDGSFYRDGERLLAPYEEAIMETSAAEAAYNEGVQLA